MRNKILVLALALFVVFAAGAEAAAQNKGNGASNANNASSGVQQQAQTANQGEEAQIQAQVQNSEGTSSSSSAPMAGKVNAEEHRSTVANFVQSLLQVAEREGGIGEQVRLVAQEQNQSASTTVQAMQKVEERSKIKTLFLGSDYKNLGTLRSEMVQTQNRLEQLNRLAENVENESDKTELQNQIQTLEQEQTKIETFIKDREDDFGLFGWLVKLFNK